MTTASGTVLHADDIVIATGAAPRTPPWQRDLAGAFVLRGIDDAQQLRSALNKHSRVVVVGDGVLGTEIAAIAITSASRVILVGPQDHPLAAQLGSMVGELVGTLHTERGVVLRPRVAVSSLTDSDCRVSGVVLDTGERLDADVVVVAVGAVPATEGRHHLRLMRSQDDSRRSAARREGQVENALRSRLTPLDRTSDTTSPPPATPHPRHHRAPDASPDPTPSAPQ
ncbi:NAD(P)/FAD-dependent oxidoreductase [Rhodococcus sp. BP-149]|nr:NAD(P)/FAD-dependent oxidoreductase [Rhodococcus sp. BP-288]MBY6696090.1 NAD(P)/FAD-dependent oxidoreductase [Rhodococcus sp. BP-188]MBY6700687.1 NAD(P)/FAD-dependent oxidoreductase [Rhodococcus sp. BP-285]MBY6705084.1 NAD(P)/FAD-dependent oxidoreductase [Rhodococcus sp. BP-283]MBY6713812.1 NAD(P)/FAD-dependent oxidoreductase [Rhodococcus sp. BP-160]MBY6715572.1 NAD(P)/FAD-dependent oxidoreductase [Rhodococcus sp. BP-110]MBY6722028.1 NAD(P)/FAD-dependent oxidoreductase [Rhodococcus sp. BP-